MNQGERPFKRDLRLVELGQNCDHLFRIDNLRLIVRSALTARTAQLRRTERVAIFVGGNQAVPLCVSEDLTHWREQGPRVVVDGWR